MQIINIAYELAKLKFEWKNRKISQEWYFEHLRETAYILIESWISENVSIYQVVVALLHDVIEDTNMTYDGLVEALSNSISTESAEKIATWIKGLTKNNWHKYILSKDDTTFVKYYEQSFNKKWKDTQSLFDLTPITKEEKERYKKIKLWSKILRNIDYAQKISQLDDETLEIKFSDRLHNLRTQWDPNNIKQVYKKVKETKLIYLPLAKRRNTTAYTLLVKEIKKLEKKLWYNVDIETQIDNTKTWTQIAIENIAA